MKATGIIRRIDDLGRIVLPKEIRKSLKIKEGDKEAREKFISRKLKISFKCNTKVSEDVEKMQMTYFK